MNPPDVYDADGHPYDRRHETRRDDDPSADVTRGAETWARMLILHRGKVIAFAVALSGCVSSVATFAGYRYVGPKQDVARVEQKMDTLSKRVGRLEETAGEAKEARAQINARLDFVIYMGCVQMKRTDPDAVPPICNEPRKP